MFEEGTIVYFDPFYFKNGNTAKSKYFIVLKNTEDKSILASLPTRKDSIPTEYLVEQGCIELPNINFNCFVFSPKINITTCQKSFDFPTHVYGYQIDLYKTDYLQEIYPIEGTDYIIWGKMKKAIFNDLINCLKTSKTVKRKFIKILS
ncbi:hypothetical protein [Kordia jejudonensis]|uniref:hypothetical protein n=1 Tax=Kordia jejudonensis TaxID=1348245 RepID=UPI0006290C6F|nr:hypothetical protein [Kordia jejudonensis]